MIDVLFSLLNLYVFSTGRRIFAMGQVLERAKKAKLDAIAAHCEATIAHDRETRKLEARWAGQPAVITYSPELRATDISTDNCLIALRDAIDSQLRVIKPEDPLAASIIRLQKVLFPQGAGTITSMNYVEEIAEVDRVLEVLAEESWKPTVAELHIQRHIARLTELAQKYHELLEAPPSKVLFDQVHASRQKGQRMLHEAVAMIMGRYPSASPEHVEGFHALMGPILKQNDAIGEYYRTRRAVQDVNPDTGEVEPAADGGGGKPT
jgi:hypothetical protein